MLWLGLTIAFIGLVMLAIGVRGRVVSRGVFCRQCRFDRAGLEPAAACPECGQSPETAKGPRPYLRQARRRTIAASVTIVLCGSALLLLARPTNAAKVWASLPDSIVLGLQRAGSDRALSEIINRLERVPPLDEGTWSELIERGLAHQADADVPWDPRWGDVLACAVLSGRMSEAQVGRYLDNGLDVEIRIRDRAAAGERQVGFASTVMYRRISVRSPAFAGNSGLMLRSLIAELSVSPSMEKRWHRRGSWATSLSIPRDNKQSSSTRSKLTLTRSLDDSAWNHAAGIEIQLELENAGRSTPVRAEQQVRKLRAGQPVVRVIEDEAAASEIAAGMGAAPLRLKRLDADAWRTARERIGVVPIQLEGNRPHAISGVLFLEFEGAEYRLGGFHADKGSGTTWVTSQWKPTESDVDRLAGVVERVLAAGMVTLVMRTDPEDAADNPFIDEVVQISARFEGVEVIEDPEANHSTTFYPYQLVPATPDPQPKP